MEQLKVFNEHHLEIGEASRSDVHQRGLWHETFHCWFSSKREDAIELIFQIRSQEKKDFPRLLDITAAGHIMADETYKDGVREVHEELGVSVKEKDLISLGIMKDVLVLPHFIDRELCHVYLYPHSIDFDQFTLQKEEVSGIVRAELEEFEKLWFGILREIKVNGFQINEKGEKEPISLLVNRTHFVPHEDTYIKQVIKGIQSFYKKEIS